jgi:hypothetical protein
MLMINKYLKKESIMSKEDQELFINILPESYKNNVMYYLNNGYSTDAILTIFLAHITEQKIIDTEITEEIKASYKRTSDEIKKQMGEDIINQLFKLAKKYNLDTFIEVKSYKFNKKSNRKPNNKKKIKGETIKTKYSRGQKLEKEVNGNKLQYEIRGMCINIRDEEIAKNINEEQIEVLYNIYQDNIWVATTNEKELEKSFKIL